MGIVDYDNNDLNAQQLYGLEVTGDKQPYNDNNPKHIDINQIDQLTLADYRLTPADVNEFMFGIRVIDPETGQELPDSYWTHFIAKSVSKAEMILGISIFPQVRAKERTDFDSSNFVHNNFIQTDYRPIIQVQSIGMNFNNQRIINYPSPMWKIYHLTGQLETFPANLLYGGGGAVDTSLSAYQLGLLGAPFIGNAMSYGYNNTPQINEVTYVSGLLQPVNPLAPKAWEMPEALSSLIAKYTLKEVLEIWGELILKPGQAATSIAVDGMSQHIDTTLSAENTGATARIMLIDKEIDELLTGLQSYFGSVSPTIL